MPLAPSPPEEESACTNNKAHADDAYIAHKKGSNFRESTEGESAASAKKEAAAAEREVKAQAAAAAKEAAAAEREETASVDTAAKQAASSAAAAANTDRSEKYQSIAAARDAKAIYNKIKCLTVLSSIYVKTWR